MSRYKRGKAARRTRRSLFRRGFDRTAGFYGRYRGGPGTELKFHDVDLDDAVIDTAGTVTASVNLIAQGTTESERDGRACTIKRIGWRYKITVPELDAVATPGAPDTVRVIMFLDKQCNGATATVTGILEAANYQSFNNLANKSRFRTLYDRTHQINYMSLASDNAGVVSQGAHSVNGSFYKDCNIKLEFDSTTGAITEIRSNNIGVLLISAAGVAAFDSKIRLRFVG